jgi:hypothetical protein
VLCLVLFFEALNNEVPNYHRTLAHSPIKLLADRLNVKATDVI